MAKQGRLVDVRGLQQVDRALRDVAPDLRREFYKELGGKIKTRVDAARSAMPYKRKAKGQNGGHLRTNTYLTKAGAKVRQTSGGAARGDISGGRKQGLFGFKAVSAAPHASILDLAKNSKTKQGAALVSTLNARYGHAPRFLGKQLLPGEGAGLELYRESQQLVSKYVGELNRRIENAASSRSAS